MGLKRDLQFLKFNNPFTTLYWYRIEIWLKTARYFVVQCDPFISVNALLIALFKYASPRVIINRSFCIYNMKRTISCNIVPLRINEE